MVERAVRSSVCDERFRVFQVRRASKRRSGQILQYNSGTWRPSLRRAAALSGAGHRLVTVVRFVLHGRQRYPLGASYFSSPRFCPLLRRLSLFSLSVWILWMFIIWLFLSILLCKFVTQLRNCSCGGGGRTVQWIQWRKRETQLDRTARKKLHWTWRTVFVCNYKRRNIMYGPKERLSWKPAVATSMGVGASL